MDLHLRLCVVDCLNRTLNLEHWKNRKVAQTAADTG